MALSVHHSSCLRLQSAFVSVKTCHRVRRGDLSDFAGVNACHSRAQSLPGKRRTREQKSKRKDRPWRRDAQDRSEIDAENLRQGVATECPDRANFKRRREKARGEREQRQGPGIRSVSAPLQHPPRHEPEERAAQQELVWK